MRLCLILTWLVGFLSTQLFAQHLDSLTYLRSYTKEELDSTLNAEGIPAILVGTVYDINVYKVNYNTVSYDSTIIPASGMLAFPSNADCRFPLLSYNHGTKVERNKVPSRISGSESLIGLVIASNGYVATLPDYIGLGDSPLTVLHLSNHAATLTSAGIDLLRAVKEAEPQLNFRLNGQLFITGYSEGGYAAMVIHREIEQHLQGEFTVTACAPMSGAYDLSGTMFNMMLSDSTHPNPLYLPYIIFSWNQVYHFYNDPSEICQSPYDTTLPPLFDGSTDDNTINSACPDTPKLILKPDLLDSIANDSNHPFRMALRDNDAFTNWIPSAPIKILFCKGDMNVPWQNAETAMIAFTNAGCTQCDTLNVSSSQDHVGCAQFAVLYAKGFFESLRLIDSCTVNAVARIQNDDFTIYPNPAMEQVTVRGNLTGITNFYATDLLGREWNLTFTLAASRESVSVKELRNGYYVLTGESSTGKITVGHFIKYY